jgi:hypothetical protein
MCDIFDREIVSIKYSTANSKQLRSSYLTRQTMSNEVMSFCFSKKIVIHRCLRSKSSLFDKWNDLLHTLQRQHVNKYVLDLTLYNLNLQIFLQS